MSIIKHLRQTLEHLFDFTEDFDFQGVTYQLYGRYYRRDSRYFAVKKAELYAYTRFEHILFKSYPGMFRASDFVALLESVKNGLDELIKPNEEHMSSVVTFLIECNGLEGGLQNEIKNFKYRKTYKFGFWGWVDFKLILIVRNGEKTEFVESKLANGDAEKLGLNKLF